LRRVFYLLVRIGIAAKIIGVTTKTLRRWDKDGKLEPTLRTKGGHRRYETTELPGQEGKTRGTDQEASLQPPERVVGYIRVSSTKQRDDLARQREQVENYATGRGWQIEQVFQDIASGLNDQRPGLRRLLEAGRAGHLDRILITYDDRLARFGTNLLEWLFNLWGVQLERIQPIQLTTGPEQQLLKDLMALMTSFTGKFHRMRRGKRRASSQTSSPS